MNQSVVHSSPAPMLAQGEILPVHGGIRAIENARERITGLVAALEERLVSVLGQAHPDPGLSEVPMPAPRSDLAAVLYTNAELLEGQAARINRLLDRLEV